MWSKIEHIVGNKANLHRYKKIGVTPSVLSDHHGLKLEFNQHYSQKAYKVMEIGYNPLFISDFVNLDVLSLPFD